MNPDPFKGLWGGAKCRDSPVQTSRKCNCEGEECQATDMYYDQLEEVCTYLI